MIKWHDAGVSCDKHCFIASDLNAVLDALWCKPVWFWIDLQMSKSFFNHKTLPWGSFVIVGLDYCLTSSLKSSHKWGHDLKFQVFHCSWSVPVSSDLTAVVQRYRTKGKNTTEFKCITLNMLVEHFSTCSKTYLELNLLCWWRKVMKSCSRPTQGLCWVLRVLRKNE